MGFIYVAAISLVGLLLLAVIVDAVASVSSKQHWPDIRMNAKRVQPEQDLQPSADLAVAALREKPRALAESADVANVRRGETRQHSARNDEVPEAA